MPFSVYASSRFQQWKGQEYRWLLPAARGVSPDHRLTLQRWKGRQYERYQPSHWR
ncbi:hypothetical protein ISF6_3986 [Piscinibacter sakaiensis]|uniref:Uncharacterized protein n=1 Tax=Piscinibacter sakaiensis TaxID=1547922 RepID=A0A0K8NUZ1_PISS1|nr:hypothetical protein ISF6_3986 [Piscinibacter sakaiensis]